MPTTYNGDPTNFPTGITIPSDGDGPIKAADVNPAFEGLMDCTRALRPLVRVAPFRPTSRNATPEPSGYIGPLNDPLSICTPVTTTDISVQNNATKFKTANTADSKGFIYWMALGPEHLVNGNLLASAKLKLSSDTAHTLLPQVMPSIGIFRFVHNGYGLLLSTGGGVVTDSSANVATFDAAHDITFTPDSTDPIDHAAYWYALYFQQEGGTNAKVDGYVYSLTFTHTRP